MMSGTGEWRARLTAAEPTMRCKALDELPTTITAVSPGWARPTVRWGNLVEEACGSWRTSWPVTVARWLLCG